ncbi:uncharacterized protein LOC112566798 [Pomacea canaliculata]|uniref:uncharacterized protein LOC112566798 n=1 Tax=Pomacea canaliculata TaxID=400727 RepID=UPI000D72E5D7|nr:uncharacterized protein LOC112566798 [Pomacea canaliculata]
MRNLAVILFVLAVVGLSAAYWIDGMYVNQYDDDADYINEDKRRGRSNNRELCIPWRSSCPSDSSLVKKYSFLKCCDNLACRCTLWGNNCKCESTLGGK